MARKLLPTRDRVLIRQKEAAAETAGGIIVPDTAKDNQRPGEGTVVVAGPGTPELPMAVKEGDEVLFSRYSGTPVFFDGEEYLMMKEEEILSVIEG